MARVINVFYHRLEAAYWEKAESGLLEPGQARVHKKLITGPKNQEEWMNESSRFTWDHLVGRAHEEIRDEGEEGGVEAIDRRKAGQESERHAWGEETV